MFSPTETRIRKGMTEDLQQAIDIELYAMFEPLATPTVSSSDQATVAPEGASHSPPQVRAHLEFRILPDRWI
ncbi:hypothetical protein QFC19_001301 [Naganishia cerealis]|uniref:Uncharacterized protein n=1 Tax=Naganishia cerealis TaxID=610337 RepID=A0ACC2WJ56_9TREE|nr:hypothetical protein QFC19_001301 [Naganishia cerealis]